ncbi:MAG: hypothetical protein J6I76_14460 [Oribacterium sp.]|nr:hypothetical protein [Oribacterium sp.]
MNSPNYIKAKILTLIPLGVFVLGSIILGSIAIDYFKTGNDATAIAFIFVSSLCLILTTVPCMIMSVLGTLSASKAKKEGIVRPRIFFILGMIEIAIYGVGILLTIIAVLMTLIAMR